MAERDVHGTNNKHLIGDTAQGKDISRRAVLVGLVGLAVAGCGTRASAAGVEFLNLSGARPPAGKTLYTYKNQPNGIWSLSWSKDGKRIASGSLDVEIWDALTGKHVFTYPNQNGGSVLTLDFSPDGTRIASGSTNVQIWDPLTGKLFLTYPLGSTPVEGNANAQQAFAAHSKVIPNSGGNMVYASAWSPDGKMMASALVGALYGNKIHVWDTQSGKTLFVYKGGSFINKYFTSLSWSPDGKRIASASADKTVHVWDATSGKNLLIYKGHSNLVSSVEWSADSSKIVSGSYDGTAQIWDASSGKTLVTYHSLGGLITVVDWSHDGKTVASAGTGVELWDATSGKHILTYAKNNQYVRTVKWSPNDLIIASSSVSQQGGDTVKVWEAR